MKFNERLFTSPDIESAIDPSPLVITPETLLTEAIAMMGQAKGTSCRLRESEQSPNAEFQIDKRSSYALIMTESELQGILTERDVVKLTAQKLAFDSVVVAEVMTQPLITLDKNNFPDIFAALFLFRRYRIRHLPIMDENNNLLGVVSPETIRQAMRPANLLKLRRVRDVMSQHVIHALTTDSVWHLVQLMTEHQVSCVIITEADEAENILCPVGIITERDILQFQCLQIRLDSLTAGEVMSSPLFLLSPEDSLLAAHQEMQRRRVRRLVVSWNWGRGLGIITQTSMLRIFDPMEMYGVIETLQSTIQQLEAEKAKLLKLVNQN
ncbi:MAG: CBS domain-containing protein [Cyanobacteria bacterium J06621_8]